MIGLLLGFLAGVVATVAGATWIGAVMLRRRVTRPAGGADDKMRAEESALAVLNAGDPARRRTVSHSPRR